MSGEYDHCTLCTAVERSASLILSSSSARISAHCCRRDLDNIRIGHMSDQKIYFGWIPMIVPKLVPSYFIDKLLDSSEVRDLGGNDYNILPFASGMKCVREPALSLDFRSALRSRLGCSEHDQVLYLVVRFSDLRKNDDHTLKLCAIVLNSNNVATRTIEFDFYSLPPASTTNADIKFEDVIEAEFEISEFNERGLVSLKPVYLSTDRRLDSFAPWLPTVSRYHFELIRNLYHEHVNHSEGDFLLFPVEAKTPERALDLICDQYTAMAVSSLSSIRNLISYYSSRAFVNESEYLLAHQVTLHSQGSLSWCAQFHKLFRRDYHDSCIAVDAPFHQAKDSIGFLDQEMGKCVSPKLVTRWQKGVNRLSFVAVFVSFFVAQNTIDWLSSRWILRLILALVFTIVTGAVVMRGFDHRKNQTAE